MEKKEAICLVCLRECKLRCIALQDTIPLDGDKELVSYAEAYTNCTQLDVNVGFDGLPEWLCNSCSCDLRCAYDFRIKAKESFEKLSKQIGIHKPKQKDVEGVPGPYEFSWVDDNNETENDINTDVDLLETCSDEDIADDEDPLENNMNNNVVKENFDAINQRLQSPASQSLDNVVGKSSKQVTASLSDETGLKTDTTLTAMQPITDTQCHPPTPNTSSSVSAANKTITGSYFYILDKNDVKSMGEFDVIENNQSGTEFPNQKQKDSTNEGIADSTLSPETQLFSKGQKKCSICEHSYFTTSGLNAHMEVHQVKANYSLVRKPYRKPLKPRTETEVFDADLNSDTENKQDSVTNIERSAENEETKVHKNDRKKSKAPKPKEPQSTQPKPKPTKSEQTTAKQIWACKLCVKSYTSKHSLNHHMRTHTGERPFECTICGDRFICNSTLKTHQRRHTGERPYACEECGKRFIQHSSMMAHVKLNHMDKTLQCPHCIKKYARKLDLEAHLLSHTGYKGFKCYLCPTGFVRQSNLEKHLRNVHPNEADSANMADDNAIQDGTENTKNRPYLCDLCPSRFTQQSVLSKHINQVHAKEPDRANKEDTISNEPS